LEKLILSGMVESQIPERYFYHSFPRRSRSTEQEITSGLAILRLIRDFGLLLTPEIAHWEYPHADGTPPRSASMLQRRVSFTELGPSELARHSEDFGHFTLEFKIETLKQLGAMPVFYIPRADDGAGSLGNTMVMQIIDAMRLIDRIARVLPSLEQAPAGPLKVTSGMTDNEKIYSLNPSRAKATLACIGHALAPPDMIRNFLEGTLNLFYPADGRDDEALQYYRQREWRIFSGYAINGTEVMHPPSEDMICRLLELDKCFFDRPFPPNGQVMSNVTIDASSQKRLVDWVYVLPGLGERRILELARRVVVPDEAIAQVKAVLSQLTSPPQIVGLSELAQ
jgi:hypothetical protein